MEPDYHCVVDLFRVNNGLALWFAWNSEGRAVAMTLPCAVGNLLADEEDEYLNVGITLAEVSADSKFLEA